jgi:hypothetical protein
VIDRAAINSVAALVVVGLLVGIGWIARGWREDSVRLDTERTQAAAYVARLEQFDRQAQATLTALQDARDAAGGIQREIVREVTKYRDRPCLDSGAVGLLNDAAAGAGAYRAAGQVPPGAAGSP